MLLHIKLIGALYGFYGLSALGTGMSIMSGTVQLLMEYTETHPMHAYTEQSIKRTHSYTFPKQKLYILLPGLVEYDFPLQYFSPENQT